MATPAQSLQRRGRAWQDDELDAIVADYFAMLGSELATRPYSKSSHNAALATRIGRSRGSIEFKHCNISAVLEKLGLPRVRGYSPRTHFQSAILDAIDRHLEVHPRALECVAAGATPDIGGQVFVHAPALLPPSGPLPERLRRLMRKFDPVSRDFRNRKLGRAGEEFALRIEQSRLAADGRDDLAQKVRWVSAEDGDGAGYDILSFDKRGRERLLEVKTTNGPARTPFFLSRNELELAGERPREWRIYRVHDFALQPRIFAIAPPLPQTLCLSPETWRASFQREPARPRA